jgi:competence protein ComEA
MFLFVSPAVFAETAKVNINTATVAELVTLKGIGEKTANSIIEYRQTHGQFKTITELVQVKGIGEKTFAKFADQITVGEENPQ